MRTLMLTSGLMLTFMLRFELINTEGYQYDKPTKKFTMPAAVNQIHSFLTSPTPNLQNFASHAATASNQHLKLQQDHYNQAAPADFILQQPTTFPDASHNTQNYQQVNAFPAQNSQFATAPQAQNLALPQPHSGFGTAPQAQNFALPQPHSGFGTAAQAQNLAQNNVNQVTTKQGDYISQSEASQLDQYPYKQRQAGDSRPFRRFVTTCYQDGHCDNQEMPLDGMDQHHQSVINALRAQIQYSPSNCPIGLQAAASQNVANTQQFREQRQYIPPNHSQFLTANNANFAPAQFGLPAPIPTQARPLVRPPERRLYPYNEIVGPGIFN